VLLRIVGWVALIAFAAVWVWACLTGLHLAGSYLALGLVWTVVIALPVLWLRWIWLLYACVFIGAWLVWRWPLLLALLFAVPRAFLMLPGAVSTYLANWRHPRAYW
jgi:hypothetical protein